MSKGSMIEVVADVLQGEQELLATWTTVAPCTAVVRVCTYYISWLNCNKVTLEFASSGGFERTGSIDTWKE